MATSSSEPPAIGVTMLGHASLVIETADCRILMDPVLFDPHGEGLFAVCPARVVDRERLPAPDVIVVSHRHLDHFDVRSLATLPRAAEVLLPRDAMIAGALRRLGFRSVIELDDWTEIAYGGTTLLTTASECPVPEFGVVVRSGGASVWNQVDTIVDDAAIARVRAHVGAVDLLVAPWQPMLECAFQWNASIEFPYDMYAKIVARVRRVAPGALCPGANGFRYVGPAAWLNRVVFPVRRERFCDDVVRACPALAGRVLPLDPGQSLAVRPGAATRAADAGYARTLTDDREALDFRPNQVAGELVDANEAGHAEAAMDSSIAAFLAGPFAALVRDGADDTFAAHRRWDVVYQLTVVFPRRREQLAVDFREATPQVRRGRAPLANFSVDITASALHGLLTDAHTWAYAGLGGHYRVVRSVLHCGPAGATRPPPEELCDPLWRSLPFDDGLVRLVDREVARWGGDAADHSAVGIGTPSSSSVATKCGKNG
jgi:UDP-MurNAc hydroxylase